MKDHASHVSCETSCGWKTELDVTLYDIARFFSKVSVKKDNECWEWRGRTSSEGYGRLTIGSTQHMAHRLSLALAIGPITDPELVVRHKCDNRLCVNPNHLETGTQQENMEDRRIRDRTARGQNNGRSKLTEEDVRKIRADTRTSRQVAADYGVGMMTIQRIKNRSSWGHLSDTPPDQRR